MKKSKFCFMALAAALMLSAAGCGKETDEVPVVTVQPVLGEDVNGYAGFAHLQAYDLGETARGSVLYLPADENAYVGGTCIISKAEGVEVTLNYEPMMNEKMLDKPVDKKLQYVLDTEFSEIYADDYEALDISKVTDLKEDTVGAEVSYLEYDDRKKIYKASFIQYLYTELEDGREFKTVIKVDSDEETDLTAAVIEELERYFGVEIPYENGFLQAKIDGYDPDDQTLLKMNSNTVSFGVFDMYFPDRWEKNELADVLMTENFLAENGMDEAACYTDGEPDADDMTVIFLARGDGGGSSGELAGWDGNQRDLLGQYMEKTMREMYQPDDIKVNVTGNTDLGFVLEMALRGYDDMNARFYYIFRGDDMYILGAMAMETVTDAEQNTLFDTVEQIYSTMEVR